MIQMSARIENDKAVRVSLGKWQRTLRPVTVAEMEAAMDRAAYKAIPWNGGGNYNVEPRGTYQRTGNLGASTSLVVDDRAVRIKIEAPYAAFVVGRFDGSGQVGIHEGRWTKLKVAVDDEIAQLIQDVESELQQAAEAVGL